MREHYSKHSKLRLHVARFGRCRLTPPISALLVCGILSSGCTNKPGTATDGNFDTNCQMTHVSDLNLTWKRNIFVTPISVNNQSVTMTVDTGSTATLLKESAAKRVGLHLKGNNNIHWLVGDAEAVEIVAPRTNSIDVGGVRGEGLLIGVGPERAFPHEMDGILG